MKIIIPNADFSAVKIGVELDLHAKTSSILSQVTGTVSDAKKTALDNIVRWIISNGYENSVATMIVPFAAATIPQALRNVWANNYPAFNDVTFDPTAYLTLANGAISSVGKSLSDTAVKTLVGRSMQVFGVTMPYSTGMINIAIGDGGNVNAYDQSALISGGVGYFGLQNSGNSFSDGYSPTNNTIFVGKLVSAFVSGSPNRYFNSLVATSISSTSGTLSSTAGLAKASFCFGLDQNMKNKFVCLISGSITDAKLIELKGLVYALHLLL